MFYFWQQCVLYLCFSVRISANKLLLLLGAYPTWGIAADVFLEQHGQAFQISLELHLQPQVKYPKFQHKTPKCGWLWQMIQWTQVNSAQVPYLYKCDSVTISQPHMKLMWSNYMHALFQVGVSFKIALFKRVQKGRTFRWSFCGKNFLRRQMSPRRKY